MKKLLTLLLLLTISICLTAKPKHQLEYNVKKGSQIKMKTVSEFNSKVDLLDIDTDNLNIKIIASIWQNIEIIDVNSESFKSEISVSRIKFDLTTVGMPQTVDSDDDSREELSIKNSLIGKRFHVTCDKVGKIILIEDVDSVYTNQSKDDDKMMPEIIKSTLDEVWTVFPDYPVAVGESWSKAAQFDCPKLGSMAFPDSLVLNNKFTLRHVKKNIVTLDVEGEISRSVSDTDESGASLKGTCKGSYIVNTKTGAVNVDIKQKLNGVVSISDFLKIPMMINIGVKMSEE